MCTKCTTPPPALVEKGKEVEQRVEQQWNSGTAQKDGQHRSFFARTHQGREKTNSMKITLQPSADQTNEAHPHATVTIEIPGDCLTLGHVVDNLLRPALLAWGFHPDTIEEHLPE